MVSSYVDQQAMLRNVEIIAEGMTQILEVLQAKTPEFVQIADNRIVHLRTGDHYIWNPDLMTVAVNKEDRPVLVRREIAKNLWAGLCKVSEDWRLELQPEGDLTAGAR